MISTHWTIASANCLASVKLLRNIPMRSTISLRVELRKWHQINFSHENFNVKILILTWNESSDGSNANWFELDLLEFEIRADVIGVLTLWSLHTYRPLSPRVKFLIFKVFVIEKSVEVSTILYLYPETNLVSPEVPSLYLKKKFFFLMTKKKYSNFKNN